MPRATKLPASLLAALLLTALGLPICAQDASTSFVLVGDAKIVGDAIRLTPAKRYQRGAAWLREKRNLAQGFDASFRFRFTEQDSSMKGADGLAFVIQNSGVATIGALGGAGGFAPSRPEDGRDNGIDLGFAVFFDTFKNPEDPSDNFVSVSANGPLKGMRWPPRRIAASKRLKAKLKDGKDHVARILYRPPNFQVIVDGAPVLSTAVNLAAVTDADGSAYVGFTASTGNGFENHDLFNFTMTGADSTISTIESKVGFCQPDRTLCTPFEPTVEEISPGRYHVVLPATLDGDVSIPAVNVEISNATGTVCWDAPSGDQARCNGPEGDAASRVDRSRLFLPGGVPGALVKKVVDGKTLVSVNDIAGQFEDNSGYFEFDVVVR